MIQLIEKDLEITLLELVFWTGFQIDQIFLSHRRIIKYLCVARDEPLP